MSEVTFSAKAYCKIILHAAKYSYCSINGLLLTKSSSGKSKEIHFVDAVPLFHIALNLTPMAEIALMEVDQYAAAQGLVIAGYYTAHENLKESSFERANHRISEKIAENYPGACLVVVDNRKLSHSLENIVLKAAQFSDGKYRPIDQQKISLKSPHTLGVCTSLLEKKIAKQLVDFDNHLDNINLDWRNCGIDREIDALI